MPNSYPFYTKTLPNFLVKHQSFNAQISTFIGTISVVTPAQVAMSIAMANALAASFSNMALIEEYSKSLTASRDTMLVGVLNGPDVVFPPPPGVLIPPPIAEGRISWLTNWLGQLTLDENYTVPIGMLLGTEPPPATLSPSLSSPLVPVLTLLKSNATQVTIKWLKAGFDAVQGQYRIAGSTAWLDLPLFMVSPFVDTRPLATAGVPEVREYRFTYVVKNVPTNNWSNVLVVTVTP